MGSLAQRRTIPGLVLPAVAGVATLCFAVAASLCFAAVASAQDFAPGAAGVGDPYFPKSGNGGYDVQHYDLELGYAPRRFRLDAVATITATATHGLSRFNLDYRGPKLRALTVDGQPAATSRAGQELIVTPPAPIAAGQQFEVVVSYAGQVGPLTDGDGSISGWIPTGDGAFVAGEPRGAPTWFPCNDHPTDKATYETTITVPAGRTALANGILTNQTTSAGRTTFTWREDNPMATYLATATSGRFGLEQASVGDIPSYIAVDPREAKQSRRALAKLPQILAFLESSFGDYPFASTGAIVDHAPFVGYALETQTLPLFGSAPDEPILVHELAHQWFGDSLTPARWEDIWLNEGFATWSEWLWSDHKGAETLERTFKDLYEVPARNREFWGPPPGAPGGPRHLFDASVYVRGAMTLEALREKIGDSSFLLILRRWTAEHRYGNVSTPEFIALAEQESGQQLDAFFRVWLYQRDKPKDW